MVIYFVDEKGRTLTLNSMHQLTAEFLQRENLKRTFNRMGPSLNNAKALSAELNQQDNEEWEVVFILREGRAYKLSPQQKSELLPLLEKATKASGEVIREMLAQDNTLSDEAET